MALDTRLVTIMVKQEDDSWIEKQLDELQKGDIFKAFHPGNIPFTFYDTEHDTFEFMDLPYVDGEKMIMCKPYEVPQEIAERFVLER